MKRVILHGELAHHVPGGEFECDFYRASEAVSAIEANFPGFHDKIRHMHLHVVPGDIDNVPLDEQKAATYKIGADVIHIIPAIEGSGGRRGVKALLGVALIAVSFGVGGFVAGGLGSTASIGGLSLGVTGTQLLFMGAGLVLQGLVQPPKSPTTTSPERQQSSFYQGPLNTQQEGSIVPYTAGQDVIVGGVVIHTDLVIERKL
jgi:predicted phage tail protein